LTQHWEHVGHTFRSKLETQDILEVFNIVWTMGFGLPLLAAILNVLRLLRRSACRLCRYKTARHDTIQHIMAARSIERACNDARTSTRPYSAHRSIDRSMELEQSAALLAHIQSNQTHPPSLLVSIFEIAEVIDATTKDISRIRQASRGTMTLGLNNELGDLVLMLSELSFLLNARIDDICNTYDYSAMSEVLKRVTMVVEATREFVQDGRQILESKALTGREKYVYARKHRKEISKQKELVRQAEVELLTMLTPRMRPWTSPSWGLVVRKFSRYLTRLTEVS
jgi:hypothetical protein